MSSTRGATLFEELAERRVTTAELHRYLSQFVFDREPKPKLEVDTGDGSWRALLDADVLRCRPGRPGPVMLIFGTEDDEMEERYPPDYHVLVRLA
jgi:hypothetical protein